MAVVDATFLVTDRATGQPFANITLTFDDATRVVSAASGTINGAPVNGLSAYLISPNTLLETRQFSLISGIGFVYNFDNVSVAAGGVNYNFIGDQNASPSGPLPAFVTASDGSQRSVVTPEPPGGFRPFICFAGGTLIETARGEVRIEDLKQGDMAVTATGGLRRVLWVGHRSVESQPMRISAGAFGGDRPRRPLYLSPGHPVLVGADAENEGGSLVPIMCLENGTTIRRGPRASVTYWHVELDAHDILLAEGLPAESYIDGGDRAFFAEASDHALHNPDFVPTGWNGRCRHVAVDGPLVEAERVRLNTVFTGALDAQCKWDSYCLPTSV